LSKRSGRLQRIPRCAKTAAGGSAAAGAARRPPYNSAAAARRDRKFAVAVADADSGAQARVVVGHPVRRGISQKKRLPAAATEDANVVACRQTLQFDTRLVAAGAFGVAGLHFLSAFKKSALFLSGKNPNAFRENKRRTTKRGGNSENFQIEQQAKKGQCAATLRPS
jgi:hypothetical protein